VSGSAGAPEEELDDLCLAGADAVAAEVDREVVETLVERAADATARLRRARRGGDGSSVHLEVVAVAARAWLGLAGVRVTAEAVTVARRMMLLAVRVECWR